MADAVADKIESNVAAKPVAPFVHLHNHSHYSLLDGLQKVPGMLDRIEELGMDAVAITDHGTLSGTVEFYKECQKRGIRPIIGIEAYVAPRGHLDKAGRQDLNPFHLILLAETTQGYHNLMKLTTVANLQGFYGKPRIDRALLEAHHEGLIALSACAGGEVASHIMAGNMAEAENAARWYDNTFGRGNFFLELQAHEHQWATQKQINTAKIELSRITGIPLVVTADSHYSLHTNREAHETLLCVQTGKTLDDKNRMSMDMDLYISSAEEIIERFAHIPEAHENTVKIAARCNVDLELGKILIPTFPVPEEGVSERTYLHTLSWQGLAFRYGGIPKEDVGTITEARARELVEKKMVDRLDYELGVISKMGYEGYFLIVADFINWGKNQGIVFGPGRGSAAGSIVAYVMNITDLDPMKYDLLFERFLNPDRISMPDIDVDIEANRRGEVIDYVTAKYGEDRVSQIITFGTMAARNAVRDTGRVLGYSYDEVDRIAKLIPQPIQGRHIPLAVAVGLKEGKVAADPDLSAEYKNNPRARKLIDLAIQLEGTIRNNGVHACGVVIAPAPLVDYIPVQRAQKGGFATQYSMGYVEELGLLKMDFLGLSNLDAINQTLRIIRKVYGNDIDLPNLPLDDPKTFELLGRGETTGVFQFESSGMKKYLRQLKATEFNDVIAMGALYRPGPLSAGLTDSFIRRKNNLEPVEYAHPLMQSALGSTFGVLVYQEQVMQISRDVCGFTGGEADTLRKAIGKKKLDVMQKMKIKFVEGAVANGVSKEIIEKFWEDLLGFADYCFNKSHSACYGLISYQTAYLKAHYPSAFMAALLTQDYGNIDRIAIEIAECQRLGMKVLPPDVNESFREFAVVKETGNIRFGLSAIKNVGAGAIASIIEARKTGGPFKSVQDFAMRVNSRECNKKAWESFAKTGAFDSLTGGDRGRILHNLDIITAYASKAQKNALSGQIDIFGSLGVEDAAPELRLDPPPQPLGSREQLAWEKDLMGLYLSHHPLDTFKSYLSDYAQPLVSLTPEADGKLVRVGGMITAARKIVTKKGAMMAFVTIEDTSSTSTELIVFPKAYEKNPEVFELDNVILATGKISGRDREGRLEEAAKIMIDGAKIIDYDIAKAYVPRPGVKPAPPVAAPERPSYARRPEPASASPAPRPAAKSSQNQPALVLTLEDLSNVDMLGQLKTILSSHVGATETFIVTGGAHPKKIRLPFFVIVDDALIAELTAVIGAGHVRRATA